MSPTSSQPKSPQPPPSADSPKTAKLFMNGRSQAVRLPKEFRFEGTEVAIRQIPSTGELVLSAKTKLQEESWEQLFAAWDALGSPEENVLERDQTPPIDRDFF